MERQRRLKEDAECAAFRAAPSSSARRVVPMDRRGERVEDRLQRLGRDRAEWLEAAKARQQDKPAEEEKR